MLGTDVLSIRVKGVGCSLQVSSDAQHGCARHKNERCGPAHCRCAGMLGMDVLSIGVNGMGLLITGVLGVGVLNVVMLGTVLVYTPSPYSRPAQQGLLSKCSS